MLANPQSVCSDPSSYGYFTEALSNNSWDAVTLQPYVGYGTANEISSFVTIANMTNTDAEILMYATWPWQSEVQQGFSEEWYANPGAQYEDTDPMAHRRSWYEYALGEARDDLPGREVNLIPVGDVWAAIGEKFEQGAYVGINDAGDLYRDTRHATSVGRYIAHVTTWAVMHKQNPALYPQLLQKPSASEYAPPEVLGQLISETIWEVVSNDPLTGIELSPGDFNRDGIVDLADYTVWRDGLGGEYEASDYEIWKANFGNTSGSVGSFDVGASSSSQVPEPASLVILFVAVTLGFACSMRRLVPAR